MSGFELALSIFRDFLQTLTEPPFYGIAVYFLAGIFAWSGFVKLRRPALAAMAMVDFGVVRRVRPYFGSALGAMETLLALALALGMMPHLVLPFAAILLWFFALLIGRSLASGERFACFCFGDSDSQISEWTFVRTTVLALLASLLAFKVPPLVIRGGLNEADILQALIGLSLLGTIALVTYIPKLLKNPFAASRHYTPLEVNK